MTTIKVVAAIVGVLFTALAYAIVFSVITLRIHHARALGLASLEYDPLFWLFGILVVGTVAWGCWRWVSKSAG